MGVYRAAVIGLGAMGMGVAKSLLARQIDTVGCDMSAEARDGFALAGGKIAATPREAAAGADALLVTVVNAEQTEAVLFGPDGAVSALAKGAVVLGCATVPPTYAKDLAARLARFGILFVDAPMSGGPVKAAAGQLSLMTSGDADAYARAEPALGAIAGRVYKLGAEPGQGSTMKMVNQLLAGVHIATAMEAVALGIKAGLDASEIFNVITGSAGNSWMFENRVPHVLANDYAPKSAVEIFVKDLGIVLEEGKRQGFPLPLSAAAHQIYLAAKGMGLGREDDAAVIKVYQALSGIKLPAGGDGGV